MPGFVIERYGYTTGAALIAQVVTDMIANGFTIVYKSTVDQTWNQNNAGEKFKVVLEAGPNVDPLNATNVSEKQPWRIMFDVQNSQLCLVHAGTPTTLPNSGAAPVTREFLAGDPLKDAGWQATDITGTMGAKLSATKFKNDNAPTVAVDFTLPPARARKQEINGYLADESVSTSGLYTAPAIQPAYHVVGDPNPNFELGTSLSNPTYYDDFLKNENLKWEVNPKGTIKGGSLTTENSIDNATKCFINRALRMTGGNVASYPMSYRLAITSRGIWLGVWEDSTTQESSTFFNWFLIQRPVDRTTGETLITGKAPVFCVNAVGGKYWKFTVRERDIFRPSARLQADIDLDDSEAIFNSAEQVSLSEDGKYIVTFPSRLNTSRYRYPHELDMLATTSADVVSQNTDVPLTVYGEDQPRTYRALHANALNNTGMRVLVLQSGGSIS